VDGCLGADPRVALPPWLHAAAAAGNPRANPKGLPTAAFRAAPAATAAAAAAATAGAGGDPAAHLRLLMRWGLVEDALDISLGLVKGDPHAHKAPGGAIGGGVGLGGRSAEEVLLPECGHDVWLPYAVFDRLLELAERVRGQEEGGSETEGEGRDGRTGYPRLRKQRQRQQQQKKKQKQQLPSTFCTCYQHRRNP